jgi:hypothetical protein
MGSADVVWLVALPPNRSGDSLEYVRSRSLLSLADVALDLRVCDVSDAYRVVIGWLDEHSGVGQGTVEAAIADAPALTGDERLDALLAAAAEHAAFHADSEVPDWLSDGERFLRTAWFPIDLPSLRVRGLVSSPASFARRGIFVDRSDLERV